MTATMVSTRPEIVRSLYALEREVRSANLPTHYDVRKRAVRLLKDSGFDCLTPMLSISVLEDGSLADTLGEIGIRIAEAV